MLRRISLLFALTPWLALATEATPSGPSITVYNWNDYIAPQVLENFERDSGIHVDYHTYATAEELLQRLDAGDAIDVAVPSHDALPRLIREKRLQPLDFARLPNRRHLDKPLLNKLAAFDPQNRYAVPYLWGSVGLAINQPKAEAAYGGPLPNSWSLLFDPQQSARLASCGMSVIDAPDEVLLILLNYTGYSFAHSSTLRLRATSETLDTLRPRLKYVDSERYIDDLANGRLCVSLAWVGDALAAAKAGQPVRFMIPEEGSALFIDNLVIPAKAPHPELAHRFIDYLMQPQVAGLISAETLYPSPNADAQAFIDPALRDLPGLYPDRDTKRRLFALEPLPDSHASVRDDIWARFRSGK